MADRSEELDRRRIERQRRNDDLLNALTITVERSFHGTEGPGLCLGTFKYTLNEEAIGSLERAMADTLSEILDRYKHTDWPQDSRIDPLVDRLVQLARITLPIGTSQISYDENDEYPRPHEYNRAVSDGGEEVRAKAQRVLEKIVSVIGGRFPS